MSNAFETGGALTGDLKERVRVSLQTIRTSLRDALVDGTHWAGKLSNSALSTATAVSALSACRNQYLRQRWHIDEQDRSNYGLERWESLIEKGSVWLSKVQNTDGGFGDTDRSLSNIATTLLVIAAWELSGHTLRFAEQVKRAWQYVDNLGRWDSLRKRYGKDKTFVVPIMTNCAIAGLLDWKEIPTLPFEAAALPQSWYRFAKMPVVSYAVPALVAIGQAQFVHAPPKNPVARLVRKAARASTLRVLATMQPTSGGYLEATPLTSFVLMSLASIDLADHMVSRRAMKFIVDSVMPDGSWPIDTNLATWLTSLTMKSYFPHGNVDTPVVGELEMKQWERSVDWLLSCQHRERHPFTGAEPGGWGWTNLSGSVPDSDDTPAALLALGNFYNYCLQLRSSNQSLISSTRLEEVLRAKDMGCLWLVRLQNSDGGWPTFCKGWGTLPFDRSGSDLTAHALRALHLWKGSLNSSLRAAADRASARGWNYLRRHQHKDGSWLPLWFGNQDRAEEDNPIYGTARVLLAYGDCGLVDDDCAKRAIAFLQESQREAGGWGGGTSIQYAESMDSLRSNEGSATMEETAVALEAMIACGGTDSRESIEQGIDWLCKAMDRQYFRTSQPIGFYFAKLWYHEELYPLTFSLSALERSKLWLS
ncbi:MAG: prenyltransferase/squalene oxidase repeat-containing protein [Pirellula sp.]|jgi:squalene-hopene/tetraprenyl-beta-curcumene cyclase|nr:squalene--hopene cyclase [Pirellula sp.]